MRARMATSARAPGRVPSPRKRGEGEPKAPTGARVDAFVAWTRGLCPRAARSLRNGPCTQLAELAYVPRPSGRSGLSQGRDIAPDLVAGYLKYPPELGNAVVSLYTYEDTGRCTEPGSPSGLRVSLDPDKAFSDERYDVFVAAMHRKLRSVHVEPPYTPLERDVRHRRYRHCAQLVMK